MVDWLLVTAGAVITAEVFLRTPFRRFFERISLAAQKAGRTVTSRRISDHWKEAVLPRYACIMFRNSVWLGACLVLAVSPVIVIDLIGRRFGIGTLSRLATGWGIAWSTLVTVVYVSVRPTTRKNVDYGPLQRLLHCLVLSSEDVGQAMFAAEMRVGGFTAESVRYERHVFVSGLARAGTTILMRAIHESGRYASLTYADMPFVLAPNLWHRISGGAGSTAPLKERVHGDGILVGHDSPEALDEVFWRVFAGSDYVGAREVRAHRASPEVIHNYRRYVAAIAARHGRARCLSKNNNNVLRLESIRRAFPNAIILVPFRDPLQHAFSLLVQHRKFRDLQRADPFARRYMSWLGHYEFGLTHKRFNNSGTAFRHSDADRIDYWLEQWNAVYRFLLEQPVASSGSVIFVSYERLCAEPEAVWRHLCGVLDLEAVETPKFVASVSDPPPPEDRPLVEAAIGTYALLDQKCAEAMSAQGDRSTAGPRHGFDSPRPVP